MLRSTPRLAEALLAAALASSACAITDQADEVAPSGFLADVGQLRPGGEGEALLVYHAPDLDLSSYRALLVEPIEVWPTIENAAASERDLQRLARLFRATVVARLEREFVVGPQRGEGVLVVRAALTEAHGSNVALDSLTSVVPAGRALSAASALATGAHAFVGSAAVEAEVLDGATGRRLMAGIDRRVGNKVVRDSLSKWSDVEGAFEAWAEQLAGRLKRQGLERQGLERRGSARR